MLSQNPESLLNILSHSNWSLLKKIHIVWIGNSKSMKSALMPWFCIWRDIVLTALRWLKFHNKLYSNVRVNENFSHHSKSESLSPKIFKNIIYIDESDTHKHSGYTFNFNKQNFENDLQTALSEAVDDNITTSSFCININFYWENPDHALLCSLLSYVSTVEQNNESMHDA